MSSRLKRMHPGLAILLLVMLVFAASSVACGVTGQSLKPKSPVIKKDLPLVGSIDNLKNLLESSQRNNQQLYGTRMKMAMPVEMAMDVGAVAGAPVAQNEKQDNKAEYSQTNVQVQGVDEGDLVKTDGQYIFQVNKNRIQVIKAVPADKMRVINTIKFTDTDFTPVDLYLDGDNLIVIGNSYQQIPVYYENQPQIQSKKMLMPPYPHRNLSTCRAIIYNIKDKNNISQVRRLELEGNYLSSRKVGSAFYLISNRYIDYYALQNGGEVTPLYRDTVKSDKLMTQDIKTIRYFPGCINPNYLVVGSLDLNKADQAADINTYLGSGESVYASTNNLYVSVNEYNYGPVKTILPENKAVIPSSQTSQTKIYKFGLEGSKLVYVGDGQVPGTILNQFSMDEYQDNFRIATTSGEAWNGQNVTKNNVYILDKDLKLQGKIEDIAPGEKIYSTRFMGNRAYMVTFKQVDPFFVLDLKNPAQPKILGKLKIPGYSDYLHPYDENHIIGFGKDTIEASGWNGQSMAYYQGMKIAIFDVTDVTKPVEMSKVTIGDRGTDSELLRNHKALLFSREKNLLALPVNVMTIDKPNSAAGQKIPEYGSFSFQGAYVYNIDLKHGLQLKGTITHLSTEDYQKAGNHWDVPSRSIERILYIGDNLYTLSPDLIKTNQLNDLKEMQALSLE